MGDISLMIVVFGLCFIIGYFLISRVPQLLHTPLMSMTNAISGVTILGALFLFSTRLTVPEKALGVVAVAMATLNLVGGFAITDRMLKLFKKKQASNHC